MKDVNEFVNNLVKIEFLEEYNCFGHYPFQMCSKDKDGSLKLHSLCLSGDVNSCYNAVKLELEKGCTEIFISLDFPAGGDIDTDFIAVFSIINNITSVFAIPYDNKGNVLERLENSYLLSEIHKQFKTIIDL